MSGRGEGPWPMSPAEALAFHEMAPHVDTVVVGVIVALHESGDMTEHAAVMVLDLLEARQAPLTPDTVQAFRNARAARIGGE